MNSYDDGGRGQRVQSSLDGYQDVAERIRQFKAAYPNGSLQPRNPDQPIRVIEMKMPGWAQGSKQEETQTYLEYVACAYRTPDDVRPGIGIAWERFPGITPYTRHSEAMNCETSANGRAIVAALAADSQRIASRQEVQNREFERQAEERDAKEPNLAAMDEALAMLTAASDKPTMITAWNFAGKNYLFDVEVPGEGMAYRAVWRRHLDHITGLGQGTESPAPVAPPEAAQETAAAPAQADQPQTPEEAAEAVVAATLDGTVADGSDPQR